MSKEKLSQKINIIFITQSRSKMSKTITSLKDNSFIRFPKICEMRFLIVFICYCCLLQMSKPAIDFLFYFGESTQMIHVVGGL